MNLISLKLRLSDVLVHQPFDCQDVYLYSVENEKLVPADDLSAEFLKAYNRPVNDISFGKSPVSPIWFIGIQQLAAQGRDSGLCCSGCRVASIVVVVTKRVEMNTAKQPSGCPIDDYFIDALRIRIAEIMGVDVSKGSLGSEEGLYAELRALEVFESDWRRVYGDADWLAVKGRTVVAHAPLWNTVEQQVKDQAIEPPVLYVPPKKEEHICEMFSIGL